MAYVYINPTLEGYYRLKVSRKQHNELFPHCKVRAGGRVEYYYNFDTEALIFQRFTANWAKALIIILGFIPATIMEGLPQAYKDIKNILWERSGGHFIEDRYFLKHDPSVKPELKALIEAHRQKFIPTKV